MGRLRGAGRALGSSLSEKPRGSTSAGGGGGGYGDEDVAKLKEAIQTLCQSTHPLGEIFFNKWYGIMQRGRARASKAAGLC